MGCAAGASKPSDEGTKAGLHVQQTVGVGFLGWKKPKR